MGDLLDDIINFIIAAKYATVKDVDIFKDYSPLSPDTCTSVYEYNGSGPGDFTDMSVRSIQVVCRAKSSASAKIANWNICKSLYSDDGFITIGSRKCIIAIRNTPIKIDVDEQERTLWAFNFALTTNFD